MDYGYLTELLSLYGLPSVIISVAVALICFLVELIAKNKISCIKGYIPFISGVMLYFVYSLIFFGFYNSIKAEILYSGVACGSLGVILKTAVKKIFNGKIVQSQTALIIEGIICDIDVDNLSVVVAKVERIFTENVDSSEIDIVNAIASILKEHAKSDESTLENMAHLIAQAVKALNSL